MCACPQYEERAKLFTWKPVANLLGAIVGSQLLAIISSSHEDDSAYAALLKFDLMTIISMVGYALLLWGVT